MINLVRVTSLISLVWTLYAGIANAQVPMTLDGGWVTDQYENAALPVPSRSTMDPVTLGFDFTLTAPAQFTFTDCCIAGDQFNLYDGVTLLASSAPLDGEPFGDAITGPQFVLDDAFDDPQFDGLQVLLGPGPHQLRMELTFLGGGFVVQTGVRLDTFTQEVPALGAVGYIALGLALSLIGIARNKRRRP